MSNAVLQRAQAYAGLVKLSHSVFAMPFALLSLLVATDGAPSVRLVALVIAAVVAARTAAMAFNRYADRHLDAANPRTQNREIPSGVVSARSALALTIVSGAAFLLICWMLSVPCLWLGVPTLAWLLGYSYAKRFSSLCHLWLGVCCSLVCRRRCLRPASLRTAHPRWGRGAVGCRLRRVVCLPGRRVRSAARPALAASVAWSSRCHVGQPILARFGAGWLCRVWLDGGSAAGLSRGCCAGRRPADLAAPAIASKRLVADSGGVLYRQRHVGRCDVRSRVRRPVSVELWLLPTPASN